MLILLHSSITGWTIHLPILTGGAVVQKVLPTVANNNIIPTTLPGLSVNITDLAILYFNKIPEVIIYVTARGLLRVVLVRDGTSVSTTLLGQQVGEKLDLAPHVGHPLELSWSGPFMHIPTTTQLWSQIVGTDSPSGLSLNTVVSATLLLLVLLAFSLLIWTNMPCKRQGAEIESAAGEQLKRRW